MTISDETLMAFADGELTGADLKAVESALLADPELQERVARHRGLRARLQQAFATELNEPVPERLIQAAKRPRPQLAAVVNLQDARRAPAYPSSRVPASWWRIGAIAASLMIGVAVGYLVQSNSGSWVRARGGNLVANRALAQKLSSQLGRDAKADSAVNVGVSFLAKSGRYCRTFSVKGERPMSGLACRAGREWNIEAVTQADAAVAPAGGFRTAGSPVSPLILQLVEQQIVGEPLDQQGEAAAQRKDWTSDLRDQKSP